MSVAASHRGSAHVRRLRLRVPLTLRARVLLKRGALDGLLAAGADPSWGPELALRAVQITALHRRRALGESLARVVREAHLAPRWSCAVPLDRRAVRGAAPELRALTASLTLETPPAAQGVALASQLLRHPNSPLYLPSRAETLCAGAEIARRALD
jgi:hypothetical protein